MLDRDELAKQGPPGFNLGQKEKDYAQHYLLSYLSRSGFSGVFKGGTCLQKAYGLPRHSEDLDFTLDSVQEPDFDAISAFLSSAGFSRIGWQRKAGSLSSMARLRFAGPLYNGTPISEGSVALEFSKRDRCLLPPVVALISPPYSDLLPYQLRVMDKGEIASEKVRAIMTRISARDLFDLYFLLHQQSAPEKMLIDAKLAARGLKFDEGEFLVHARGLEGIWQKEMAVLTSNPPAFKEVFKSVREKFSAKSE